MSPLARPSRSTLRIGALCLGVALLFALRGHAVSPDSASYLSHQPYRPPGYPLFIDLARLLGGSRFLRVTAFLQALLGAVAVARLVTRLRARLGCGRAATVAAGALLFFAQVNYAPEILSESLSYSLFLLLIAEAVEVVYAPTARAFLRAAAWTVPLILVRAQFLFLVPLLLVSAAAVSLRLRGWPERMWIVGGLIALAAALTAIQRGYNYVRTGQSQSAAATGIQLLTVNTYLADRADLALVSDPDQHAYFARVLDEVDAHHQFMSQRPESQPSSIYFADVYHDVCQTVITRFSVGRPLAWNEDRVTTTPADWAALDRASLAIALKLMRAHPKRYLVHVAGEVWGSTKYFGLLVIALTAVAAARARSSPAWLGMLLLCLVWLSNVVVVSLIEAPMTRYYFYTDATLGAYLLALLGADARERSATGEAA